jgi:signal transduction histidine kinase
MRAGSDVAGAVEDGVSGAPVWGNDAPPLRLLLVDDSRFDMQLLEDRLQRDGLRYRLHRVTDEAGFRGALAEPWDLVLSELDLPQFSALAALAILRTAALAVPLIVLTEDADEAPLRHALDAGAVDYVLKTRLGRLTQSLRLAVERARLIQRLEAKQVRMAHLSVALINAQEGERKALARELHDELGQRLSALNLLLHRSQPWFVDEDGMALWRTAEREMTSLVGMVRDLSVTLRPPGLDFFGLEVTIEQLLAHRFQHGPAWVFEYAGLPQRLLPVIEISVFRIVQESVTNIVRYAQARNVVVEINGGADARELELIVRDDGVGFDAAGWREYAVHTQRAGLVGMSERVQLLGGTFDVDSNPGRGTRIAAVIPLLDKEINHERRSGG